MLTNSYTYVITHGEQFSVCFGVLWAVAFALGHRSNNRNDPEYRHGIYGERLGRRNTK